MVSALLTGAALFGRALGFFCFLLRLQKYSVILSKLSNADILRFFFFHVEVFHSLPSTLHIFTPCRELEGSVLPEYFSVYLQI